MWHVAQYERYRDERARPFFDLIGRIPDHAELPVHAVADLGCGAGDLTRTLLERFPEAEVIGVDTSAEMLTAAAERAVPGRLRFERADAASWRAPAPLDVLVSNATLHWLPDHERLLPHLVAQLGPSATLAVQMPDNGAAPSHRLIGEVAAQGPWAERLRAWAPNQVHPLPWYVERLWGLGFEVDAWETTYMHVLSGDDAVLEWVKGTTLRPILRLLDEAGAAAFLDAYGARLRAAYPATGHGTLLPFRRVFFVARRG
ncbi:MAG: methyltransferase domain-containing protein [Deltaproteobacteria bacterium]|nr:methyltransferase domain-containing protein [Deltaproteobacteria bacterium]